MIQLLANSHESLKFILMNLITFGHKSTAKYLMIVLVEFIPVTHPTASLRHIHCSVFCRLPLLLNLLQCFWVEKNMAIMQSKGSLAEHSFSFINYALLPTSWALAISPDVGSPAQKFSVILDHPGPPLNTQPKSALMIPLMLTAKG